MPKVRYIFAMFWMLYNWIDIILSQFEKKNDRKQTTSFTFIFFKDQKKQFKHLMFRLFVIRYFNPVIFNKKINGYCLVICSNRIECKFLIVFIKRNITIFTRIYEHSYLIFVHLTYNCYHYKNIIPYYLKFSNHLFCFDSKITLKQ